MTDLKNKSIHVPLPPDVHASLMEQASRLGAPATTLARTAIEAWVRAARRRQLDEEIHDYALAMATTTSDLDEGLEATGIDSWIQPED